MEKKIELRPIDAVKAFEKAHNLTLANPEDLASKNPDGYFTRDGGYVRTEDNPHYETLDRTGAFAILFAGSQMLLVTPPWTPKTLEIAGGGAKGNETIDDAILRELKEEIGFEPDLEQLEIFAEAQFYMNLTAEDAHRKFLNYNMIMKAIDITPTMGHNETLESLIKQYKPEEKGNVRYVVDLNNNYDVDALIQSHPKLNGTRLGHHLFIRKAVERYREFNMDMSPSTQLSDNVPNDLIKAVEPGSTPWHFKSRYRPTPQ